jgi:acetylornithine/N-succinyldiaminopimelate aminotransferase
MNAPLSRFDAIMPTAKRPPVVMVEGHGSWLEDDAGREYLDFVQGWAVNCLGHSPRVIADVVASQAARLVNCSPSFYSLPLLDLADQIVAASSLDRVFFTNCGAEANEGAIKLARKWGGKARGGAFELVTMKNAFHGRTLATMSASDKAGWDALFEPKVPGFVKVEMNDLEAVARAIGPRTAGVMLELIQGEAGVQPASAEFVRGVRALTRDRGVLLIVDEIQTGVGRTGTLFGCEQFGLQPDIMTLGKGIAGGAPLGALVAREDVACFDPGDQGGTFNGNALVTAIGAAVFRTVREPPFLANVRALGEHLAARLGDLCARHGEVGVRGRGLLLAMVLRSDRAAAIVERAFERGLLLNAPRPNVLRFMPALNVTPDEIDELARRLDALLVG